MKHCLFLILAAMVCAVSCEKTPSGSGSDGGNPPTVRYSFTEPELAFAFSGQKRYSYCPVVLEQDDGSRYVFMCGNQQKPYEASTYEIIVDNIYQFIEYPDGSRSQEKSVLQPSLFFDDHHTCDPSVIQGEFKMDGETYKYAMFYTGACEEYFYNEVGVAFSNDLNADTWVKYPNQVVKKTWVAEGDLDWGGGLCWGCGQPSAVSLDKKGQVLLTYTIGDISGTRVVFTTLDMSDMDNFVRGAPTTMSRNGLIGLDGKPDYTCDAEFAINQEENKIVMVRPVQPHPTTYPNYIPSAQEVDYMDLDMFMSGLGTWTSLGRIDPGLSGFPRNHNAGLMRDNYGHIGNWDTPTVYFTVSKESPDVYAHEDHMCEWTYTIYKTTLEKTVQ